MRTRRRSRRAAELTALIDVLFILLFAALIQARHAAEQATQTAAAELASRELEQAADAGLPDAGVSDANRPDELPDAGTQPSAHLEEARNLASHVARSVRGRAVYVAEIDARGVVTTMSRFQDGQEIRRDLVRHRLLRPVPPAEGYYELEDIGLDSPENRLCTAIHRQMAPSEPDLGEALIVVITTEPLAQLPIALYEALEREARECFARERGSLALMLDPAAPVENTYEPPRESQ